MPFFKKKQDKAKKNVPPVSVSGQPGSSLTPHLSSDRGLPHASARPNFSNGDVGIPKASQDCAASRPKTLILREQTDYASHLGASSITLSSPMRTSSRLSKTLLEILHDKDALSYFVQFMESRKAGQLVRFWLDSESFQAATWSRIRTHSSNSLRKSSLMERRQSPTGNVPKTPSDSTLASSQEVFETANISGADSKKEKERIDSPLGAGTSSHIPKDDSFGDFVSCDDKKTAPPDTKVNVESHNTNTVPIQNTSQGCENKPPEIICDSLPEIGRDRIESHVEVRVQTNADDIGTESILDSNCCSFPADSVKTITEKNKRGLSKDEIAEKLKKSIERDAVGIFSKYLAQDASHPINICDELRNTTIGMICLEDCQVDPNCFSGCQDFVINRMDKEYYHDFLRSEYHCQHQIDVLTGGKVYLGDFLYNETAFFYFMEYMEQEKASNLLQFWMSADNFQQLLIIQHGNYDWEEAQNDAMVLYDKYFSLQATQPLGFPDQMRLEVEGNICREKGPLPDCFAKPRDMVLKTIEKVYFPTFLQSELYYKFLSELVTIVQTAQDFPIHRKRAASESSSEHSIGSHSTGGDSISSKNTLLAKDSSHFKKALSKLNDDIRSDPMLTNPDTLWKRANSGKLSVGRINKLGQFTSEFDPEPDSGKKKDVGFFKKKPEKEKAEEEMALKIAQMIISDVTAVTDAIGSMQIENKKDLV
ncbi:hypothetical protein ScPMuIL_005523 [Solemya velum]